MMGNLNQKLKLADNRNLGYAEYGERSGKPVFHFHGSGSSRLERPAKNEILAALDIHFISVDRPGHGLSNNQPNRCLIDWAKDIVQLANHLHIDTFYVSGLSAGGPHALACAHELPERVIACAAISSAAPMSRKDAYVGMPILNQLLARSSRKAPWITKQVRRLMRNMMMGDVKKAIRQLMLSIPESDKEALYDANNLDIFVSSIREGFFQGYEAVADDDILINGEWGFTLENIKPRVDIWHGDADVNVPIQAAEYLAAKIPHNRVIFLQNKGHFFVLDLWDEILKKLIDES